MKKKKDLESEGKKETWRAKKKETWRAKKKEDSKKQGKKRENERKKKFPKTKACKGMLLNQRFCFYLYLHTPYHHYASS